MNAGGPFFFGPQERPLFGWYHGPEGAPRDVGVVICNPLGYEAICAHRSLRHLARHLAHAGFPTLRFDYDGTGDSAGHDRDPDRLARWVRSVHAAADDLKTRAGVSRIAMVGVRMGAALAALAASERDDTASLVWINGCASGRTYLRELRALQAALDLRPAPAGTGNAALEDGAQEAVGFVFSAETASALGRMAVTGLTRRPAPHILMIERDDLPHAAAPAVTFRALEAAVSVERLPGFAEMMLDPHNTQIPTAIVHATTTWLAAQHADLAPERPVVTDADGAADDDVGSAVAPGVREQVVFVDRERRLFGVLSSPAPDAALPRRRAVLLLPAGAIHRVGPNRLYVEAARRWARLGYEVLRFDIGGIGDSEPPTSSGENVVYSDWAIEHARLAMGYLTEKRGKNGVVVAGLCSGAYHGFHIARAALPSAAGVIMINPIVFYWTPGTSLDVVMAKQTDRYRKGIFKPEVWAKLLRGQIDLRLAGQVVARRAVSWGHAASLPWRRRLGFPAEHDLGEDLRAIVTKGIDMFMVFCAGDPGIELLNTQAASTVRKLRSAHNFRLQQIDGPDHTFTPIWAHELLLASLTSHLLARHP